MLHRAARLAAQAHKDPIIEVVKDVAYGMEDRIKDTLGNSISKQGDLLASIAASLEKLQAFPRQP